MDGSPSDQARQLYEGLPIAYAQPPGLVNNIDLSRSSSILPSGFITLLQKTIYLLKEERSVIFGDACGPGTLVMEEFSTDISTYLKSLLRLKSREDEYDAVYRFHGTCISEKKLLDTVIMCCRNVLNHTDEHIPVPAAAAAIFPIHSDIPAFMARKPGDEEGNLAYRLDKVK